MSSYDSSDTNSELETQVFASPLSSETVSLQDRIQAASLSKDRILSIACMRLFFLLLFALDLVWGAYCLCKMTLCLVFSAFFFYKKSLWENALLKTWISLKRSLVCGLSLFVSLFSTGFGIMIACTYFVMYDKEGIEEVVPSSLQSHFKDFFKSPAL